MMLDGVMQGPGGREETRVPGSNKAVGWFPAVAPSVAGLLIWTIPPPQAEGIYDQSSLRPLITGPDEGVEKRLGADAGRLHDWMFDARTEADAEVLAQLYARTGAILMGPSSSDRTPGRPSPSRPVHRQPRSSTPAGRLASTSSP